MRRKMPAWMLVVVIVVVVPAGGVALAWTHAIHTRLAAMSYEALDRPGDPSAGSRTRRSFVAHVNAAALAEGSVQPDKGRGRRWWLNDSHKTDNARIYDSWKAAIAEYSANEDPVPSASNRIGRAFHYLQDQTELRDATRSGVERVLGTNSRTFGEQVLEALRRPTRGSGQAHVRHLQEQDAAFRRFGWSQVLGQIPLIEQEFDGEVSTALAEHRTEGPTLGETRRKIHTAYERYFASVVALQNQIIRLYHEKAEEALALRANRWAGTWEVRSQWDQYPERNTTWTLKVYTVGQQTIAETTNGRFICAATDTTLDFTDNSNRIHRSVDVHLQRNADGKLGGSFKGTARDNTQISGLYFPRRKVWPGLVIR